MFAQKTCRAFLTNSSFVRKRFSTAAAVAASASTTQFSNFSTNKKIVDIRRGEQKDVWEAYLVGSISAENLFSEIDLNKSGKVNVEEINYFLDSVERSGVKEDKFELLQKLGQDHELDMEDFNRWLCMATDLRRINPQLEGILDGIKEEDSSDSSSDSDSDVDNGVSVAGADPRKAVDARRGIQAMVWDTFLTTGCHASDLFKMIDLNRNNKISVSEIAYFIDSVEGKGVDPRNFGQLKARGEDHELGEKEFIAWLTKATGVDLADGEIGGGPDEDAGKEQHSTIRDDAEGCTPGQW